MLGALAISVAIPTTASAVAVVHPVLVETSSTAGAAATGVFIGVVAAFDIYDIIRRATCSGDFLALGDPGFTSPITSGMNVMIPGVRLFTSIGITTTNADNRQFQARLKLMKDRRKAVFFC